jgi:hypothetical protein
VDARNAGKALTEDLARAGSIATTKPPDGHPQFDGHALPRKILEATAIAAMLGSRHLAAERADWFLLDVNSQSESVYISFDAVQYQNVGVWEKRLRMAWGRCHRQNILKHS